jgi:PAS domain S-box-containing protein
VSENRDDFEPMPAAALRDAGTVLSARREAEAELTAAKEALRQANARMENMLESLTDAFCAVDFDWRITYINGRALQLLAPLNKTREGLLGKRLWDEFEELGGSNLAAEIERAMSTRQTGSREFFYPRLAVWIEARMYPSPDGLTLYFHDVTRRRADQQALIDGNSRLQVALAAGRLGDWRWDAASDRISLGERAAEILGLAPDEPHAWSELRARLDEPDRETVHSEVLHAFASRTDLNIECRLLPDGGQARWVALVGRADYADPALGDSVTGMTGVMQDISARKNAEDSLRQSEEVLRALANTIPQLAWMARADGAIVWFNERWYEYTGSTPDSATGWGWQDTVEPDALPAMLEHWRASIRSGAPFEMEYPIRGADGQYRWFLTRVNAVRDRNGKVVRWFGTNTDVDQVKRVEQALREESKVLELLNSTGSALASTRDLRSLLQVATDAASGIAGARFGAFFYHGRESDGSTLLPQFSLYTLSGGTANEFQSFGEPQASALFGPGFRGAGVIRSSDILDDPRYGRSPAQFSLLSGQPTVRSYLAVPVTAGSGEVLGTMFFGHPEPGMFTERTERIVRGIAAQAAVALDNTRLYEAAKQAAEERKILLESEREARAEAERSSQMKDEFLATLSHELRTPLSAILGWAQVLRRGGKDEHDLQRGLQTIERNARAQAQLIEDLLDMSRITSGKVLLDMQHLNPQGFLDAAIETVRPAADAKNIRIEKRFTSKPGELEARDGSVVVTVRDTGAGIRPEFITHVFERFRQADASMTRRHGGLGLGLAIVKHLIEQHGGTVRADSAGEGLGSSFSFELPLAKAQTRAERRASMIIGAAPGTPPPAAPDLTLRDLSGASVLVVDDDRDARELIARILTDCHAKVRIAASAREAFAALQLEMPDLLISDLGMPEVDGLELLSWVRALPRDRGGLLPAVALTAFARSEDRLRALEAGFSSHISKPVEPNELIDAVGSLIRPAARRNRS